MSAERIEKIEAAIENIRAHCHGQANLQMAHGNDDSKARWETLAAGVRLALDEVRVHLEAARQDDAPSIAELTAENERLKAERDGLAAESAQHQKYGIEAMARCYLMRQAIRDVPMNIRDRRVLVDILDGEKTPL